VTIVNIRNVFFLTRCRWLFSVAQILTIPYLTSGVGRLLHLPSAEAISALPNAHPRM